MKNWRNQLSFLKKISQNRCRSPSSFRDSIVEGIISSGGVKSQNALVKSVTDKRFQQRNKRIFADCK